MNLRRHYRKPRIERVASPRTMSREELFRQRVEAEREAEIQKGIAHRRSLTTREGLIKAGLLKPGPEVKS